MVEFTGERVVPGQVDTDLWNEHLARYAFAARFAGGKRVLDAGCGTGYGTAELAATAASATGIDVSPDAVSYAREHFRAPHLRYLSASCSAIPLPDASIDLAVSFEVIEHLAEWRPFLAEVRRLLAPGGQFIISTPNLDYYADSRRLTGPNPYHVHEFSFSEFAAELRLLFPNVTLYLQNHVAGIAFQPVDAPGTTPAVRSGGRTADPASSHFFLAVCSTVESPAAETFVYLPATANLLRERELHIERLASELATKDTWLAELRAEKENLVEMYRKQKAELEASNAWAADLSEKLTAAQERIVLLQNELQTTVAGYQSSIAAYERTVVDLQVENLKKAEWATSLQNQLEEKGKELVRCVGLLDTAENTVRERTEWAQRLDYELKELQAQMNLVRASRWFRLGRAAGLGPVLPQ